MHKSVGVLDNPLEGRGCRMGAKDVRAEYASTVYKFFFFQNATKTCEHWTYALTYATLPPPLSKSCLYVTELARGDSIEPLELNK